MRLNFTKRSRLVGVLILALLLLGFGFYYASTQNEHRAAIQAIRDAGGRFGYDYENYNNPQGLAPHTWVPPWLQRLIGPEWKDMFHQVDYVIFEGGESPTDETMAAISKLPKITLLVLWGNRTVTSQGYAHIGSLKNLTLLSIQATSLDDTGMLHLKDLKKLQHLQLCNTQITDQSAPILKNLPALKELWLDDTKISKPAARDIEKALPKTMVTY
ncbi:MAG TPA: leucine-rich repeat domain-containing protein [Verrucomicrobiae bacterium]